MFPPAIDTISLSLAVAYSDKKYMNKKLKRHHVTSFPTSVILLLMAGHGTKKFRSSPEGGGGMAGGNIL